MDTGVVIGIIINAGLLVITGAAAVATIVQARLAVAARADAEAARDEAQRVANEATDAFKRQAAALEKSNDLKEAESRPPAWSGPKFISGQLHAMTNSSGKAIKVHHFDVQPDGTEGLVRIDGPQDNVYRYGDSFDFMVMKVMGPRPKKLVIFWHYEDESEDVLNQFIVVL